MKYRLSKLVGRNQLPGDEVAFQRLEAAFGEAAPLPHSAQRRQRIDVGNGVTRAAQPDDEYVE